MLSGCTLFGVIFEISGSSMNFLLLILKFGLLFCGSFRVLLSFLLFSHSLFFVMPSTSWFRRIRAKRKKGQVEKDTDDDVVFDTEESG